MKTVINIVLCILFLACIYSILYIGVGVGWPICEHVNADAWNHVFENLSYSYLAGCVFYILTVTIPMKIRRSKLEKVLQSKIGVIVGKLNDSKQCVRSVQELQNNVILSDSDFLIRMENTTLTSPSAMSFMYKDSIANHLRLQKKDILDLVSEIQRYNDLLSDKELKVLADLTNCEYFDLLKIAGSPVTDNPQIRRSTAVALLNAEKIILEIYKC